MTGSQSAPRMTCRFCTELDEPGRFTLYQPCHSQTRLGELCQACLKLAEIKAQIEAQIGEAKKAVDSLLERHREIREQMNRVHDLLAREMPGEIMSYIFQLCMPALPRDGGLQEMTPAERAAPVVLSAVCKAWRQIAWSTPQLWNFICIGTSKMWRRWGNLQDGCNIARERLSRSGGLPLMIRLDVWESSHEHKPVLDLVKTISRYSDRWYVLDLRGPSEIFSELSRLAGSTTILRTLRLCGPHVNRDYGHDSAYAFKISNATPEEVILEDVLPESVDINWNQVTRVHTTGLQLVECHQILRQAPRLRRCAFAGVHETDNFFGETPVYMVVHKALQELILQNYHDNCTILVLDKMSTPDLQSLAFGPSARLDAPVVSRFLKRSSCVLRELIIDELYIDDDEHHDEFINLLKEMPSLLRLDFSSGSWQRNLTTNVLTQFLSATSISNFDEQFLPELELVKLKPTPRSDIEWRHIANIFGPFQDLQNPCRRPLRTVKVQYTPSTTHEMTPTYIDETSVYLMHEVLEAGLDLKIGDASTGFDLIDVSTKYHAENKLKERWR